MRKALSTGVLLVACTFVAGSVRAQDRVDGTPSEVTVREAARLTLRPELRDRVVHVDTVTVHPTRRTAEGRVDVESGVYRARYRIREDAPPGAGPPQAAALDHLVRSAPVYGIDAEHLEVESIRGGRHAQHVRFRQTLRGVPVYRADVTVSLDRHGSPTMVVNGYANHLDDASSFDSVPAVSAVRARRIVQTASDRGLDTSDPELVVYPSKPPRLVWLVVASSPTLPVTWEVLVDAETGNVMQMLDVSLHAHGTVDLSNPERLGTRDRGRSDPPTDPSAGASFFHPDAENTSSTWTAPRTYSGAQVDGTGWVFDPDPLTSAGVSYGGEYVDGEDADTPALSAELFAVPLRDLSQGSDGLYRLDGPYVRVEGQPEAVPKESDPHAFTYTRADDRFEAVNAYYHVDKSQRYVQSLDVGFPIKNEPVRVNPAAFDRDDSNYDPGEDLIRFGTGGIDDAEDADVIWHEYAHVLLNFTTPGLTGHFEGNALHEGWADYWAASYSRFLSEVDPQIPPHNWRRLYNWDGNVPCWPGRTLDHTGWYPDEMAYEASGCQVILEIYQWGLLWATTLMEIYPQVGREVLDRLNLASHAYLGSRSNFGDAAEALLQADYDLYGGRHSSVLVEELGRAGYVDPEQYGPMLTHVPLGATEETGGTVRVEATATATTAPVDSVLVRFTAGDGTFVRLALVPVDDNVYTGELPLPDEPATVRYYLEAVDVDGRRRRLPTGAPAETYAFDVGPDTEPPSIRHEPKSRVSVIAWPVSLFAEVADNLSVDSVWAEFTIRRNGSEIEEGVFGLAPSEGVYSGRFPQPQSVLRAGDVVTYRLLARDAAAAGNVAAAPEEGAYKIDVVEDGLLRTYNFEGVNEGLTATGLWALGEPQYGLRIARSGAHVWATVPAGQYPDTQGRSSLDLPAIDLDGLPTTYLVFWHWHDMEHDGTAEPGSFSTTAELWDGANVKVWSDTWGEWRVVEPRGGYNGTISSAYANPLGGEAGWGGYSFGWRREIVELPAHDGVRVRFDFGTDDSNAEVARYFAGWYVDDVMLTTELAPDTGPPSATGLPPGRIVRVPSSELPPTVSIQVHDDIGVEAVYSEYEVTTGSGVSGGRKRLAMSGTDAGIYEGAVVPAQPFAPGDRIEYTLLVVDFEGNQVRYGGPFVVDFLAERRRSVLTGATPTGAWHRLGSQWIASAGGSGSVSSLVLQPFTLPAHAEGNELLLEHAYHLEDGAGGNLKISVDDGASWTVLEPVDGYDDAFPTEGGHPISGQPIFAGPAASGSTDTFDLSAYGGRTVRLRIDLGHTRALSPGEFWSITQISTRSLSGDETFEVPIELQLHANFPDPVSDRTTISYSIPGNAPMPVRLSVYDILGRRAAVIRHAQHEPGTYTVTYDARGLPSGVYVLYLETPRGTRSERMVVVH